MVRGESKPEVVVVVQRTQRSSSHAQPKRLAKRFIKLSGFLANETLVWKIWWSLVALESGYFLLIIYFKICGENRKNMLKKMLKPNWEEKTFKLVVKWSRALLSGLFLNKVIFCRLKTCITSNIGFLLNLLAYSRAFFSQYQHFPLNPNCDHCTLIRNWVNSKILCPNSNAYKLCKPIITKTPPPPLYPSHRH